MKMEEFHLMQFLYYDSKFSKNSIIIKDLSVTFEMHCLFLLFLTETERVSKHIH